MSNIMSSKDFSAKLNGVIRSASTARDNIQILLDDAMRHFETYDGEATKLTQVITKVKGVKSLNTTALKQYIEAHTNAVFTVLGDGTEGFKKPKKKAPVVIQPDCKWYEYKNQTTQPQAFVVDKKVASLVKSLNKAKENQSEIRVDDKENLRTQLAEIQKFLDDTEAKEA